MANEVTVPILPCASIDETAEFYTALGFTRTYHQTKPNPHMVVERDDLALHFAGINGFDPAVSYASCIVVVDDIGEIYEAFAAGMRATYGKVLLSGIPRMTRPRRRKNIGGLSGFSVVDTGGNWIRFFPRKGDAAVGRPEPGRLGKVLENAVVLGESKGDHVQAAKILDGGLRREAATATALEVFEALVYRAELAARAGEDPEDFLARADAVELTGKDRALAAEAVASVEDLRRTPPSRDADSSQR